MGYTIKQKIDICLKAESNPDMTQTDLAEWAHQTFQGSKKPSQTTISRILSSKNELIASKQKDFSLVRRRKRLNPILRQILTEWVTQSVWESIPITTPIIQSTANSIWTRLPMEVKDGNGVFNHKWCTEFIKDLHMNLTGDQQDIANNCGYKLNKIWGLDEKYDLKKYLSKLIVQEQYQPQDIFSLEEFQLFYSLPLDQIFDMNSIDKGLKQSSSSTENSLTIMLGTNLDGSEKLTPLIVGKHDKFDVSKSSHSSLRNFHHHHNSLDNSLHTHLNLMNKLTETYNIFYKNNINKWITSTMFQNYLITLEHKLSNNSPKRKILIILDDSSTHRILNLKFDNIKLVYLKNNTSHKSPFNSLFNGVNFDFCPMNFGIVHEFKTLYRLQQYMDMISLQNRSHSSHHGPQSFPMDYKIDNNSLTTDVLSETDYAVPLIKAIEWIKRAWDTISPEKILSSWHSTHLIKIKEAWPYNETLMAQMARLPEMKLDRSYKRLEKVMDQLNVVLPWKADELLGLVNERSKATLNYISIEEIITSCLSESHFIQEGEHTETKGPRSNDNWVMSQMLNPSMNGLNDVNVLDNDFDLDAQVSSNVSQYAAFGTMETNIVPDIMSNPAPSNGDVIPTDTVSAPYKEQAALNDITLSISALLAAADEMKQTDVNKQQLRHLSSVPNTSQTQLLKHKLSSEDVRDSKRRTFFIPSASPTHWNDSLPSSTTSSPYLQPLSYTKIYSGITLKSPSAGNLQNYSKNFNDRELMKSLIRLMEASKMGYLPITKDTYRDLKSNLRILQARAEREKAGDTNGRTSGGSRSPEQTSTPEIEFSNDLMSERP